MAQIARCRVAWSGDIVTGPGLSTFYWDSAGLAGYPAAVSTFFGAVKALFPAGVSWSIPSDGDVLEDTTGELVGTWSITGGSVVSSTGAGSFARGVGARVSWQTAEIRGGRRVRGTTFLAPLTTGSFDGTGAVSVTAANTIQTAAAAYLTDTAGHAVVWSRPRPTLAGDSVSITSALVPRSVSWLRSRRT